MQAGAQFAIAASATAENRRREKSVSQRQYSRVCFVFVDFHRLWAKAGGFAEMSIYEQLQRKNEEWRVECTYSRETSAR